MKQSYIAESMLPGSMLPTFDSSRSVAAEYTEYAFTDMKHTFWVSPPGFVQTCFA